MTLLQRQLLSGNSDEHASADLAYAGSLVVDERAIVKTTKLLEGSGMTRGELRRRSSPAGMRDRKEP